MNQPTAHRPRRTVHPRTLAPLAFVSLLTCALTLGPLCGGAAAAIGQTPDPEPGAETASAPSAAPQADEAARATAVEPVTPAAVGAVVSCVICHGAEGEGKVRLGAPRNGGLTEAYLARQLRYFRSGIRGYSDDDVHGTQMRAMTLAVESEAVLDELARYLATLSPPEAEPTIDGDVEHGKQLYAVCTACHGEDGLGKEELNAPALKGQHDWYLVRQLNNFRAGLRGAHADDSYGAQMVPIMQSLPAEQDVMDVVAYINTL
jgi:cytochrome c oxidase subunit 2